MSNYRIEDFVWMETMMEGDRFPLEASESSSIISFFRNNFHPATSTHEIGSTAIDYFRFKVGDKITTSTGDDFLIVDVRFEFAVKHFNGKEEMPLLIIRVILRAQ